MKGCRSCRNWTAIEEYLDRDDPADENFQYEIVDTFEGALPEGAVREWLSRIVPSEADERAAEGVAAVAAGRADDARVAFGAALAGFAIFFYGLSSDKVRQIEEELAARRGELAPE